MFYFVKCLRIVIEAEGCKSFSTSMRVLREKMAFLVPLSAINPNWVSDISGRILFLILFINTLSMTFVRWLIRLIVLITYNCTYFFGYCNVHWFFFGSDGILPVSWIMLRRLFLWYQIRLEQLAFRMVFSRVLWPCLFMILRYFPFPPWFEFFQKFFFFFIYLLIIRICSCSKVAN